MPEFFDTHAHLDYPDYAADLIQVMDRAHAAGITRIISIGTDLESSLRAVRLSEEHDSVFAAIGWHPTNATNAPDDIRPAFRQLAAHPRVVAIGETGLDYHHLPGQATGDPALDESYKRKQADLFRQQLEVAAEFGLNCVIHQRDALEDTLAQMAPFAARVRGVFHCFVDNADAMRRILGMGSLVSFTGIVTFKNAASVRETLAATPLDRFMLETDCPYLAPMPYRGKRCEPAYVREISEVAAAVKGVSPDELSRATCATARAFFHRLK